MTEFWNQYQASIIVSSWNHPDLLKEWFTRNSWIKDKDNVELIITDNRNHIDFTSHGRSNKYQPYDFDTFPYPPNKWCMVSHSTGCGGGWAMGALLAAGKYLFFVDDKCYFSEETFDAMLSTFALYDEVGMVGVKGGYREYDPNGTTIQMNASQLTADIGQLVDEVSGFLWATPYEVYAEIGSLDPRFRPAGHEETDYAFQARANLYNVYYVTDAEYEHEFDLSAKDVPVNWLGITEWTRQDIDPRNKELFIYKWANFPSVLSD